MFDLMQHAHLDGLSAGHKYWEPQAGKFRNAPQAGHYRKAPQAGRKRYACEGRRRPAGPQA